MYENIHNATPHDVMVYAPDGEHLIHTFPRAGTALRIQERDGGPANVDGLDLGKIPLVCPPTRLSLETSGTPVPRGAKAIIVSGMVGEYLAMHPECYAGISVLGPRSGPSCVVRDKKGAILGTRFLVKYR